MQKFARTARDWMDADPENIIAVHCKGGKGRTGTIICTWLIESGNFAKAQVCLNLLLIKKSGVNEFIKQGKVNLNRLTSRAHLTC